MRYIAVYRREEDPELNGVPVAFFRDGTMMGNWPKVTNGVYNRDYLMTEIELPDDTITNLVYGESAALPSMTTVDAAYTQLVAEKRAQLTREALAKAAEDQARRELQEDGVLAPNVMYPGTDRVESAYGLSIAGDEGEGSEMFPGMISERPDDAVPGTPSGTFTDGSEAATTATGPEVAPLAETSGNVVVGSGDDDPQPPAGPPDTTPAV